MGVVPKKIDPAVRSQAVRLVTEHRSASKGLLQG